MEPDTLIDQWISRRTSRLPRLSQELESLDPWEHIRWYLKHYFSGGKDGSSGPLTKKVQDTLKEQFTNIGVYHHGEREKYSHPMNCHFRQQVGGKLRDLYDPNAAMRVACLAFKDLVIGQMGSMLHVDRFIDPKSKIRLRGFSELTNAYAFKEGVGLRNVISYHKGSTLFYVVDFKNAFPSVRIDVLAAIITAILLADRSTTINTFSAFQRILHATGQEIDSVLFWDEEPVLYARVKACLKALVTLPEQEEELGILLGSTISPWLFNIYCEAVVDLPLKHRLSGHGFIRYTRYADDLVFSWKEQPSAKDKEDIHRIILDVVRRAFEINHQKVRWANLKKGQGLSLLGLSIQPGWKVCFPLAKRKELHLAIRLASLNPWDTKQYARAKGLIAFFGEYLKLVEGEINQSDLFTMSLVKKLREDISKVRY